MYKDCYHEDQIPNNNFHRISVVINNKNES